MPFDITIAKLLQEACDLVGQYSLHHDKLFNACVRYRDTLRGIEFDRKHGYTIKELEESVAYALLDVECLAEFHHIKLEAHETIKRLGEQHLGWKWHGNEPFITEKG